MHAIFIITDPDDYIVHVGAIHADAAEEQTLRYEAKYGGVLTLVTPYGDHKSVLNTLAHARYRGYAPAFEKWLGYVPKVKGGKRAEGFVHNTSSRRPARYSDAPNPFNGPAEFVLRNGTLIAVRR